MQWLHTSLYQGDYDPCIADKIVKLLDGMTRQAWRADYYRPGAITAFLTQPGEAEAPAVWWEHTRGRDFVSLKCLGTQVSWEGEEVVVCDDEGEREAFTLS